MEGVTLPTPPEGFEYRLMKKRPRQTVSPVMTLLL